MAGFLCRVLDSDEIPVPGIRVTVTSLQNPAIVAFTGLDGIANFWVHLSNGAPQPYLKPDCTPPIALARVVFEINQSSLPRATTSCFLYESSIVGS
jgi:hypothetical protein